MITSEAKEAAKSLSIYFHILWPTKVKSILFWQTVFSFFLARCYNAYLHSMILEIRHNQIAFHTLLYNIVLSQNTYTCSSSCILSRLILRCKYHIDIKFLWKISFLSECLFYNPDKNHPNIQNAIKAIVCTMYLPECKYSTFQQCKSSPAFFESILTQKRNLQKVEEKLKLN